MTETTVRIALRDAIAEKMRRDKDVFLMGEEVAEYNGAYKILELKYAIYRYYNEI